MHTGIRFTRLQVIWVWLISLLMLPVSAHADDIGLITAKLTELSDYQYTLEADVTPQLLKVLIEPKLPSGFTNQSTEQTAQGALINVRYHFQGDRPLDPTDTLRLQWGRSGALIHAKWADDSSGSKLFLRDSGTIFVEIADLKHIAISRSERAKDAYLTGIRTVISHWYLWMPLFALAFLFPAKQAARTLGLLIAGLTVALLAADFAQITIPLIVATVAALLTALMAARLPEEPLGSIFLIASVLLGLAATAPLSTEPRLAGILGIITLYVVAGAVLILINQLIVRNRHSNITRMLMGGIAVAGLLQIALNHEAPETPPRQLIVPEQAVKAAPSGQQIARKLSSPYSIFLSVEPYEVRVELMLTGDAIIERLKFPLNDASIIDTSEQATLKAQAIDSIQQLFELSIDGTLAEPSLQRADFLTLGTAGAFTRIDTVDEPVEDAILGLTYVYIRSGPPQTMALTCEQLPEGQTAIPTTVIEPSGNSGFTFQANQTKLEWRNTSEELQAKDITAVQLNPPTWAPLSIVFISIGLIAVKRPKLLPITTLLALASFPFIRIPLPYGSALPPEQASAVLQQLLTNVYRSFDYREDSAIYDQLAISATGDQLTNIYLEQRQALELENRGGARARVETVEVTQIDAVEATPDGVAITGQWKVSGSVNHFGHTHYRQNAYNAELQLTPVEGTWKIQRIEVREESRIY